ncbi:MAG: hypothetical protein LBP21_07025 [Synergistaceae bacterium]|nr:hypothetical protein [Synergistaceae bacterium]
MQKLVAAMVLLGTLGVANEAMAYRHCPPHDRKVYVEYRGRGYGFGTWLTLPFPRGGRRHWDRGYERGRWGGPRHHRRGHPRYYYRY